jgi:RNA polymerase sigma factor (TIGR02999 family)
MTNVTQLLAAIEQGEPQAAEKLLPLVYQELRALARLKLSREQPGLTLQPTALVHEAYVRLVGDQREWQSRGHFFAAAAEAMRRILVESARRRKTLKRGGDWEAAAVEVDQIASPEPEVDLLELDEALEKLQAKDPRKAELVKLRYFAGMTQQQAADLLGISLATAERDWAYARAWLLREISKVS